MTLAALGGPQRHSGSNKAQLERGLEAGSCGGARSPGVQRAPGAGNPAAAAPPPPPPAAPGGSQTRLLKSQGKGFFVFLAGRERRSRAGGKNRGRGAWGGGHGSMGDVGGRGGRLGRMIPEGASSPNNSAFLCPFPACRRALASAQGDRDPERGPWPVPPRQAERRQRGPAGGWRQPRRSAPWQGEREKPGGDTQVSSQLQKLLSRKA